MTWERGKTEIKLKVWIIASWHAICFVRDHALLHPSVTDPVKPDPVDFFPFTYISENVGSPVPDEIYNFTYIHTSFYMDSLWFLRCTFYITSMYNSCMFEKGTTVTLQKGQPCGKYSDPVTFCFSKTRWDLSLGLFERGVFFRPI